MPDPSPAALRLRAEQALKDQHPDAGTTKTAADMQRQLHELQVHQIELEMQNDELQESRNAMEVQLEKYSDLYDFAPVGYFSLDEQGVVTEANLSGATLLGVERSRLISRRIAAFIVPTSHAVFAEFLKQVFFGSDKPICDLELVTSGTLPRWARFRGTLANTGKDSKKWGRVSIADISEIKQADDVLRRNAAIFPALIEQAPVGVYVIDDAFLMHHVNAKALPVFSHVVPLLGRDFAEIINILWPKDVAAEIVSRFRHTLATGEPFRSPEFTEQRSDIAITQVYDWHLERILLPEGRHGVVCYFEDITERKQVEEATARLAAIVNSSDDAIIGKTLEGIITSWNPGAEKMLGYSAEEVINQPLSIIMPPENMTEEAGLRARTARGESTRHYDAVRVRKDGQRVNVSVTISPIIGPDGKIVGASKILRDITERKAAEAALQRIEVLAASNEKLEQEIVLRLKSEAALKQSESDLSQSLEQERLMHQQLRHLSHKVLEAQEAERRRISVELHDVIAQTLVGINMHLGSLRNDGTLSANPALLDKLALTQKLVEHSVDTVHRFARDLRPAVFDDLGLIPALEMHLKAFMEQTGIRVSLTAFADVEKLSGDARMVLYRIVQESLSNIVKHAKASQVAVSIQLIKGRVCMEVQDNGIGFQVEGTTSAEGRKRLGLLGMNERVEMIGGTFTIRSAPGTDTTVRVEIPARKVGAKGRATK